MFGITTLPIDVTSEIPNEVGNQQIGLLTGDRADKSFEAVESMTVIKEEKGNELNLLEYEDANTMKKIYITSDDIAEISNEIEKQEINLLPRERVDKSLEVDESMTIIKKVKEKVLNSLECEDATTLNKTVQDEICITPTTSLDNIFKEKAPPTEETNYCNTGNETGDLNGRVARENYNYFRMLLGIA